MTEPDRQTAVRESLSRGDEALRAADMLLASGLLRDAVSRAYYGVLHHVRALLHSRGLDAKTHAGAFQLLHREFVKPGRITAVPGWQLAGLQRSRELADYDESVAFARAEVDTLLGIARTFAAEARALLDRERGQSP